MGNFIDDIKSLKIQSASTISLRSLEYLKKCHSKYPKDKFLKECDRLIKARPTAVHIVNVLSELKKSSTREKIDSLIKEIEESKESIARHGQNLIKNNFIVHTHCHSTEALAVIKKAAEKKKFTVVVDETRPKKQGLKTANELSKIRNIKVIFITDDAAGLMLSPFLEPNDDMIIVGCDSMRKEGFVNKIGTYLLAIAAKEQSVPLYVAGSRFKLDRRKKIKIEMRNPSEVCCPMKNVKIINPAFDITPWKFVTGVITEKGVVKPARIKEALR